MAVSDGADRPAIGRGRPPAASRFGAGQSGNPKGRPKGSHLRAPYDTVLGQKVTMREDGVARQMTAAEAFLIHVTRRGLEGDSAAARAAMAAIEEARTLRAPADHIAAKRIVIRGVSVGDGTLPLRDLGAAAKLDALRPTARVVLEPWLIEMALARLGNNRLTIVEQQRVWRASRTPWKVKWPAWWTYDG